MHLFVVTHGLQGNSESLQFLSDSFEKKFQNVIVLNSKYNSESAWFSAGPFKNWYLTNDGIDKGGERLTQEIIDFVKQNAKIDFTEISFVGSSLGGLYCRYAMGSLYNEDENSINVKVGEKTIKMKIINFVSMASPLIGVSFLSTKFIELGTKLYFFMGTGSQLVLEDDKSNPLIYKMNSLDSKEYKCLKEAKNRITICSTPKDEWKVPYQASGIVPWKDLDISINQNEMVNGIHVDDEGTIPNGGNEKFYDVETPKGKMIEEMITNLRKMKWTRIDVNLYHPQAAILTESRKEVIETLIKLLK